MSRYFYFKNFPDLKIKDVKGLAKKLKTITEDYFEVKGNFEIQKPNSFVLTDEAEEDGINHFSPEDGEFEQFFSDILPFLEATETDYFYVFDEEFPIMREDLSPEFKNSEMKYVWKVFLKPFKIVVLELVELKK